MDTRGAIIFALSSREVGVVIGSEGETVGVEVKEYGPHTDEVFPSGTKPVCGPGVFVWEGEVRYSEDEVAFLGDFRPATKEDFTRFGITLAETG